MGFRGRTSAALVIAAGIVAAAIAVIWRIHRSSAPVDTATVYGADLGAVAVAVTLLLARQAWTLTACWAAETMVGT